MPVQGETDEGAVYDTKKKFLEMEVLATPIAPIFQSGRTSAPRKLVLLKIGANGLAYEAPTRPRRIRIMLVFCLL